MLSACGGDSPDTPIGGNEFLNVGNVNVSGDRTSATLSIQASPNCEWSVSCGESWVSNMAPSSGRGSREVTITLSGVNPSSQSPRTASITVRNSSGSITRHVTLTQTANTEYLEISGEQTLSFAAKADFREVAIRSNTHWTVSITGNTDKFSVTPMEGDNDGSITISVKDNNTADEQRAVLTITGRGGVTKQLTVIQVAASVPTISLPQVTDINENEATVSFTFDSSIPVSSCGVCYATVQKTPDIKQDASVAAYSTASPVQVTLTGLSSGTTYYVYGYVITSAGQPYYSEALTLTTRSRWPNEDDVVTPN